MLQLSEDQKAAICKHRRHYIANITRLAKHRQQLLRQLQLPAVRLDTRQLEAAYCAEEGIIQQLQSCVNQENVLYLELLTQVGHGVSQLTPGVQP